MKARPKHPAAEDGQQTSPRQPPARKRGPRTPPGGTAVRSPVHGRPPAAPGLAEDAADDNPPAVGSGPGGDRLVRLNKLLADHGVASRRRCDELIAGGSVMVDGEVVVELGTRVDPETSTIDVDGRTLETRGLRKRYYVLNKPAGVVCTNETRETRPRAVDLITDPWKGRIYTIGRLDEESRGLILLTNDGDFAHRIMHPRHGVMKTYRVKVSGKIDDAALTQIREGVRLSEGRTSGARIVVESRRHDASVLEVTIQEGMNREIRRAFAKVGYKVVDLERVRIGSLTSRGLKTGRWRELLRHEIGELLENAPAEGAERARFGVSKRGKARQKSYARHLLQGGRAVPVRPEAADIAARRAERKRYEDEHGLAPRSARAKKGADERGGRPAGGRAGTSSKPYSGPRGGARGPGGRRGGRGGAR